MRHKTGLAALAFLCSGVSLGFAGPLQEARVTRLFNDVALLPPNASARPAKVDDIVQRDIAIRTGTQSRAELKYQDNTLVRLGAQTLFTFNPNSRDMDLGEGLILFQIPHGVGGAEIRTGAVTAAITGTTGFVARTGDTFKVILLEGSLRVKLNGRLRESMEVKAGQMLFGRIDANSMKDWRAIDVNVRQLKQTSKLLDDREFGKLADPAEEKIGKTIAHQDEALAKGELVATNVVVEGNGTKVALKDSSKKIGSDNIGAGKSNANASDAIKAATESRNLAFLNSGKAAQKSAAVPSAGKKKEASRQIVTTVSTGAVPLVTTIDNQTGDATVTAGNVYQGFLVDGSAATYLFGSVSSFDTSRNFDADFGTGLGTVFPAGGVATVKLPGIRFEGVNPTFDTTLGALDLAMVSSTGINASSSTIDLSNLNSLFLAAMDGEIIFAKDSVFTAAPASGFTTLQLYQRNGRKVGIDSTINLPDSDLIVDSAGDFEVNRNANITVKNLAVKSDKDISTEGILNVDALTMDAADNLTVSGAIDATRTVGQAGGTVNLTAGGEISIEKAIAVSDSAVGQENSSGGDITLHSAKTNQTAIEVKNSGQLYSLLNAASVGPGGTIELRSAGGDIVVDGTSVIADRGKIDVRNTGAAGQIKLKDATLSADVIKVGALGNNGTLTVGGGSISADTALRLYAGGSNGTILFDRNVALNGNSAKIISANTVTIKNNKIVTINGPGAAQVYTDNANYTGSGGNASTSGTFAGQGANTSAFAASPGIDN